MAAPKQQELTYENQTIVLRLKHKQTRPKVRIIKVLPALAALKHNTRYTIVSGNRGDAFAMHEHHGISSLHFTHKLTHPDEFHLEIRCEPIVSDVDVEGRPVHLDFYTIRLVILVE